jgi:hypothetical protein
MKQLHQFSFYIALLFVLSSSMGFDSDTNKGETGFLMDIVPCELLSGEQVETVLPGHDEGYTALSGGSLMKGVDSYQCSYSNDKHDIFTVVVHVAANEERFSWIKPHSSSISTEIKIGDGGWLFSDSGELKLEASKGLKVIELDLIATDAQEKTDAIIKLASVLLDKI